MNNYLYKIATNTNFYTLTQRYQMVENIKTTHVLKRALCMCFILNLVLEIVSFLKFYKSPIFCFSAQ